MKKTLQPKDPEELERWEWTRLCRRILDKNWEQDIEERLREYLSAERAEDIGLPATALNIFSSVSSQISVLYDEAPVVGNPDLDERDEALVIMDDVLREAHWAGLMQRVNYYTQGLRETLLQVVWTEVGLRLGIVTPDCVVIETVDDSPEDIVRLRLAVYIDGEPRWEVWDISEPDNPRYEILDGDDRLVEAREYVWQDEDGPWIPFVKYRAAYTDKPWAPWDNADLVNGTLDIACLWSEFFHTATKASWPQRYGLDVELPRGAVARQTVTGKASYVPSSPTSILMMRSKEGKSGSLSQFSPGGDPKTFADAVLRFQSTVLTNLGISPADLENSLASQSGIAIQLKRSAQRREALRTLPNYQLADEELLATVARTLRAMGEGLQAFPVEGWRVRYTIPSLSQDERQANLERELALLEKGLASPVDVIMAARPDLSTREDALQELLRIQDESALLSTYSVEGPEE